MECSVCLESLLESDSKGCSVTKCGHIFHRKCLVDWLKTDPSCPNCRKPVVTNQLRQVYLAGSDDALGHRTKKSFKKKAKMNNPESLSTNSDFWNFDYWNDLIQGMVWTIWGLFWTVCRKSLLIVGAGWFWHWLNVAGDHLEDWSDRFDDFGFGDPWDDSGDQWDDFGDQSDASDQDIRVTFRVRL